jgi:DNA-binding response OmpR family regulator
MTPQDRGAKPEFRVPAHIVVAEDEDETRFAISIILSAAGYQVHEAKDRARLFKSFDDLSARGFEADLLILDVEMESMSGLRLLESVRASRGPIPTILIVGLDFRKLVATLATESRTDILPKPFNPEELERAVASALGRIQ